MDKIRATFTLAGLRAHHACTGGYAKLLASLPADFPEDQPIPLLQALDSNPVEDVIWALRTVGQDIRAVLPLLAADFADSVLHIFEGAHPDDDTPRKAIVAARTGGDTARADAAAYAAAYAAAANAAVAAAYAAANAANAAHAAYAAPYAAAYAAAGAAPTGPNRPPCRAPSAPPSAPADAGANAAAYAAANAAADAAERTKQGYVLRKYFTL